jgi:nucleoside-diphosphate-sugar epimerase
MIGIIGYEGFIGSAMVRACQRAGHDFIGYGRNAIVTDNCELIIDCNGNSKKYEVNQNPIRGYDSIVASVSKRLEQANKNQKYIYLSSGEVYGSQQVKSLETDDIDVSEVSIYGNLKLQAEELIKIHQEKSLIVRPSGFVGYGLLKNPIYDLLHGSKLFVHPESRFQFCDVDWFADTVIWLGLQEASGVWNVSAAGTVSIKDVSNMAGVKIEEVTPNSSIEHHELSTGKLEKQMAVPNTIDVVNEFLKKFFK